MLLNECIEFIHIAYFPIGGMHFNEMDLADSFW